MNRLRGPEARLEAGRPDRRLFAAIQAKDDGESYQVRSSKDSEKWSDSEYMHVL